MLLIQSRVERVWEAGQGKPLDQTRRTKCKAAADNKTQL